MIAALPITLLCFNINDIGDNFDKALTLLPNNEHKEVLRYKFEKDRCLALASRLIRRYYYSTKLNIPWNKIKFTIQQGGKPTVEQSQKNGQWMDFNISHDGDWVIFGATEKTNMSIGVDVVSLKNETYGGVDDFIFSFHDQLTRGETNILKNISNEEKRLTTFFQIWGLKESYIKAHGKGLSIPLNEFCICNDEDTRDQNNEIKDDEDANDTTKKRTKYMQHPTSREPITKQSKALEQSELYPKNKITRRLKLHRGNQTFEDYWCVYLSYLDTNSVSVICCGNIEEKQPIDEGLVQLANQSIYLGDEYQQNDSVFKRLQLNHLCSFS